MHQKIKKHITALLFAGAFFFALITPICVKTDGDVVTAAEKTRENPYGWEKLSSYTTYYEQKDGGRVENIRIAAALIDGITVQAFGEFSFNKTVGRRTEEAGFQQAKIIVNGEYVQGVGGGVCQVSTTLYNAALKSGLKITEYHPHSLRVSYVPPSRDAMVSTQSDLCFFNPYAHPVRIAAQVFLGGVRVTFYGKGDGLRYEIVSEEKGEIAPPPPVIKDGERDEILRAPKNGIRSESYLETYQGARLVRREKLRADEYRPTQGIIVKKMSQPTNYG
ncbi:MAG: VanW family protein [Clostridia bacterium]|nr:VanW family protein [Clostridia bacterium]MBQ8446292.1 VanW family protein [Clostridia bacterium]